MYDGATSGSAGLKNSVEAICVALPDELSNANVVYQSHVQNIGWQGWVKNGQMSGTEGQSLRIEAFQIKIENLPGYKVRYRVCVEGLGWQNWVRDGATAGTTGQSKAILAIQIKVEDNGQPVTTNSKYYQAQAEYSTNGNYQTKSIDEVGNVTQYQYNQKTGTISKVVDAKNTQTNYTYDNLDRLTKVSKQVGGKTYTNEYSYVNDKLSTITHNGFKYTFIYDNFGNVHQTKVGNQVLSTQSYEANNGNLTNETYGNNQKITYNYDRFNRITKKTGTNGNFQYTYDAKSNVKTIADSVNNNTQTFTYDLADRLVKSSNTNGFTSEYGYDINNNTNTYKYTLSGRNNTLQYNYDNVNRLNSIKLNNTITWENSFDDLSRVKENKITNSGNTYTTKYTYMDVPNVTNKTTTLLSTIQNGSNEILSYTYDKLGNIETVKKGTTETNKYEYDELGQLIKEIDINHSKMLTYEYDIGGNIINKKEYSYKSGTAGTTPTNTITYTYGNTNWKDQLTSYNGKSITYDAIGNILTYNDNSYTWQNGRQLSSISNSSKNQSITYKYNDNGIRTQKTVNGITTTYYVDGNKVIYEKTGNNVIYYTYDGNNNIIGMKYNDSQYYYLKNGQNDIIGILNSDFRQVISYEYDSWGNVISIRDSAGNNITDKGNLGIVNPYRYRSYRYDTETGLYYLNSRYYSPEFGRFINFDNYGGKVGELSSHNGYAYCKNNPVNMIDENGNVAIALSTSALMVGLAKTVGLVVVGIATASLVAAGIDATTKYINEQEAKKKEHTLYINFEIVIQKK